MTIIMVLADTVMLRIDGQGSNTAIARAWIQQLEVSRARRSQGARGLGIGLLVGVAIGGIAGFAVASAGEDAPPYQTAVPAGAGIFGAAGALIGVAVGASSQRDRWETVPTSRWRVTVAPGNRGVAIGARIALRGDR